MRRCVYAKVCHCVWGCHCVCVCVCGGVSLCVSACKLMYGCPDQVLQDGDRSFRAQLISPVTEKVMGEAFPQRRNLDPKITWPRRVCLTGGPFGTSLCYDSCDWHREPMHSCRWLGAVLEGAGGGGLGGWGLQGQVEGGWSPAQELLGQSSAWVFPHDHHHTTACDANVRILWVERLLHRWAICSGTKSTSELGVRC